MLRYPDKTKQDALETYRNEGITVACKRHHLPSSTIYRWLTIEKREAMLAMVAQEDRDVASMDAREESKLAEPTEVPATSHEEEASDSEEEIPDMMTLLIAENEKLRAMNQELRTMNQQLRKALQPFVM